MLFILKIPEGSYPNNKPQRFTISVLLQLSNHRVDRRKHEPQLGGFAEHVETKARMWTHTPVFVVGHLCFLRPLEKPIFSKVQYTIFA